MNLALIALAVTEERIFDIVDEQRKDGPPYDLTFKPSAQGELKTSLSSLPFS